MMNFRTHYQQSLNRVLSDPSFEPPECLLDLNYNESFVGLLESCSRKICVRFAVDEAWLVLPIYEGRHPEDARPRKAIEVAEKWLKDPKVGLAAANTYLTAYGRAVRGATVYYNDAGAVYDAVYHALDAAAIAANAVAVGAYNTGDTLSTAYHAYYAAWYVRRSNPSIVLINQLRRLLMIIRESE